ncbi:MAG: hypothetical protein COA85_06090 [Robiginitomaculum sp.]|nr:MAG: hypothetical protein COA85_06090 [Robiginitomaculum sp.]
MPRVIAKPDNLDALNTKYEQAELMHPVFLNSVPKCGTHLIKNIFRMFTPVEQQFQKAFIQFPNLRECRNAFEKESPQLSWGHLLFADTSAMILKDVRHIVLVRDPYDWVLARARFFLSDNFQANLEHLKGGSVHIEDYLNMMIFGIYDKVPTMQEIFLNNAVAWLGTSAHLVRYEDIILHLKNMDTPAAKEYFSTLLGYAGISLPENWIERIETGADRSQSSTSRENLNYKSKIDIPAELSEMQKKLVDYAAPGLRGLLGYS